MAQTETLDPLILSAKIVEPQCRCGCCCEVNEVPECIGCMFGDDIVLDNNVKKLFVTLGQFSIIRLERDIQLLMPAYDVCMPAKDAYGIIEPRNNPSKIDGILPLRCFFDRNRTSICNIIKESG